MRMDEGSLVEDVCASRMATRIYIGLIHIAWSAWHLLLCKTLGYGMWNTWRVPGLSFLLFIIRIVAVDVGNYDRVIVARPSDGIQIDRSSYETAQIFLLIDSFE